jgi:glycerophosphoryl diester phosphodiesterase
MPAENLKPKIIAHRGASGYLPEHTLESKLVAHWQGADYLEQDVVATRDGELVVFHDIYLDPVTDVASLYPNRHRKDGRYYVVDFQLSEIRELTVSPRHDNLDELDDIYSERIPDLDKEFSISTLIEEIEFIQQLNRFTGRNVGIYPEIKNPAWHRQHDIDLSERLLNVLSTTGYDRAADLIFVQCFDWNEIRRLREEFDTQVNLIQLVSDNQEYADLLTLSGLAELTEFVQGLGSSYTQLVDFRPDESIRPTLLVNQIRAAGLELHPYTFRRQNLPPYAESLETLLEVFCNVIPVDAVFCDYPDVAVRVRASVDGRRK